MTLFSDIFSTMHRSWVIAIASDMHFELSICLTWCQVIKRIVGCQSLCYLLTSGFDNLWTEGPAIDLWSCSSIKSNNLSSASDQPWGLVEDLVLGSANPLSLQASKTSERSIILGLMSLVTFAEVDENPEFSYVGLVSDDILWFQYDLRKLCLNKTRGL